MGGAENSVAANALLNIIFFLIIGLYLINRIEGRYDTVLLT